MLAVSCVDGGGRDLCQHCVQSAERGQAGCSVEAKKEDGVHQHQKIGCVDWVKMRQTNLGKLKCSFGGLHDSGAQVGSKHYQKSSPL